MARGSVTRSPSTLSTVLPATVRADLPSWITTLSPVPPSRTSVPAPPMQDVVAVAAEQRVVAGAADQHVVAVAAVERQQDRRRRQAGGVDHVVAGEAR